MTPCDNSYAVADHLLWMIFAAAWFVSWRRGRKLRAAFHRARRVLRR